jgi:hypothetical protein
MPKVPALPIALPGGEMMPHMSARMRTRTIDALFEASGGFDRALAWIEHSNENFGEFFTKVWAKGAAKPMSVEHTASEGVEALLEKLDQAERQTIDITPRDVT